MVLAASGKDDASRAALQDLAGKRATRVIPVAEQYRNATPAFSPDAIAAAKEAERAEREMSNFWGKLWGKLVSKVVKTARTAGEASVTGSLTPAIRAIPGTSANTVGVLRAASTAAAATDPLASVLADAEAKRAERRAQADERIANAERQNMTTSAKRASMQNELDANHARQDDLYARYAKGAPANLKSHEEIEDWKTKIYEDMSNLKAREQGIIGDLRKKPIELGADGIAKSGLFSGAALNFSMGDGTQKAQLDCLRQLVRIGETHRDPHTL
jgi:hypothetical protein